MNFPEIIRRQQFVYSSRRQRDAIQDCAHLIKRLRVDHRLQKHDGCVNSIQWADDESTRIISAGDDRTIMISDAVTGDVIHQFTTAHAKNIYSAKALPRTDLKKIVSCASGGTVEYDNLDEPELIGRRMFNCHSRLVFDVTTIPADSHTFLTCGDDGDVRWFDLRESTACNAHEENGDDTTCLRTVVLHLDDTYPCAMTVCPSRPFELAVGCVSSLVRLYDLRKLPRVAADADHSPSALISLCPFPEFSATGKRRVTSLAYNCNGAELLVNFSGDLMYSYSMTDYLPDDRKIDLRTMNDRSEENRIKRFEMPGDWSNTGPASVQTEQPVDVDVEMQRRQRGISAISAMINRVITSARAQHQRQRDNAEFVDARTSQSSDEDFESAAESLVDDAEPACSSITAERAKELLQTKKIEIGKLRELIRLKKLQKLPQNVAVARFTGHRNCRTILKEANYWGERHVIAGSDCGHIFIWSKPELQADVIPAGKIEFVAVGDTYVVNCVQPHRKWFMLATSGIEYMVRIWLPTAERAFDDDDYVANLMARNQERCKEAQGVMTLSGAGMFRLMLVMQARRPGNDEPASEIGA